MELLKERRNFKICRLGKFYDNFFSYDTNEFFSTLVYKAAISYMILQNFLLIKTSFYAPNKYKKLAKSVLLGDECFRKKPQNANEPLQKEIWFVVP